MISVPALVVTLIALIGAALIGDFLAPRSEGRLARFVFGAAAGLGSAALVIFALGALQLWSVGIFRLIVACALLCGAAYPVRAGWPVPRFPRLSWDEWAAVVLTGVILILTLVGACTPVTDWDGLSYHLEVPRMYLRHGGFYWIPFIHHSNFPFATEMLYAPAVALGHPIAAKVVHWFYYLLSVLGCGLLADQLAGRRVGIWGALAFALVPVALWEASTAYIDLATAAYVMLSCLALLKAFGAERPGRWLITAGVMAGMAAGTKTFSLSWVGLAWLWLMFERRREHTSVKDSLLFLAPALAVCCPWYIKSLLMTGNPVYPFLFSVFGGRGWDAAGAEMYRVSFTKFGFGRSAHEFLLLPWNVMVFGGKFIDGNLMVGSAGPAMTALLPAAVLRLKGAARPLAVLVLVNVTVWFMLSQQTRYLLPLIGLASALVCAAVAGRDVVARTARAVMLAFGMVSAFLAWMCIVPALPLMAGKVPASSYIQRQVNSYWTASYLPSDARVLLYGETRGFYLDVDYIWADEGLSTLIPYRDFRTPAEMLKWLAAKGWNVALINRDFAAQGSPAIRLWDQAIADGLVHPLGGSDFGNRMSSGVELWEIPR